MNPQLRRTLLDFGPLLLFFAAYKLFGIYAATATVIAAAIAAAGIGYLLERKISPVPVVTAIIVAVLGGLTLYFKDKTFIKMKPTFVYALLGSALIGSEILKRPLVKYILGAAMSLSDTGWRGLAWRFGFFFYAMALINELIWRNFSDEIWVNYHLFGAIALTFLFGLSQAPFLLKHHIEPETPDAD